MSVLIVGAGAIGLSLAYILSRNHVDVTVVDAAPYPGGLTGTFEIPGRYEIEKFYHHIFTHDMELQWLLSELDIRERLEYRPSTMGIYSGGRIYPFGSPSDLLTFNAAGMFDRMRFGISSAKLALNGKYTEMEEAGALDWLRKNAGPKMVELVWEPMIRSKFGDAADEVPLPWIAGRLRQRSLSRRGSVETLGYLDGSLGRLVEALCAYLAGNSVELITGRSADRLVFDDNELKEVETSHGTMRADSVVATVPNPVIAGIARDSAPDYAASLDRIEYLAVLNTVLVLEKPLSGIYWLNVAERGYTFSGVIEHTALVPPEEYGGCTIVYLPRYLTVDHPLWKRKDSEVIEMMTGDIDRIFPGAGESIVESHLFRARYAAPIPHIGFHELIPDCRSPFKNFFVVNMSHIYPDERSVNNSVKAAGLTAHAMGFDSSFMPQGSSPAGKYGF